MSGWLNEHDNFHAIDHWGDGDEDEDESPHRREDVEEDLNQEDDYNEEADDYNEEETEMLEEIQTFLKGQLQEGYLAQLVQDYAREPTLFELVYQEAL